MAIILFISGVLGSDDPQLTNDTANDDQDTRTGETGEQVYSSSTITETTPESIGMPQSNEHKPHHHQKHKNPIEGGETHTRSPVYEVVNKPCYSPGCGGFGPQDAYPGNRWAPGRSRYGPYGPRYYEPRRRGGYREYIPPPQQGYGPSYAPPYPDYGYGSRGMPVYPPERFDRVGGYGRPPYDDYFLG